MQWQKTIKLSIKSAESSSKIPNFFNFLIFKLPYKQLLKIVPQKNYAAIILEIFPEISEVIVFGHHAGLLGSTLII